MSSLYKKILILRSETANSTAILQGEISNSGTSFSLKCNDNIFNEENFIALNFYDDFIIIPISDEFFSSIDFSTCHEAGIFKKTQLIFYGASIQNPNKKLFITKFKEKYDCFFKSKNQPTEIEAIYNDDEIANENYFELYQKELKDVSIKNVRNADVETACCNQTEESQTSNQIFENEKAFSSNQVQDFFSLNQPRLNELFALGTPYPNLEEVIPNSKWVKVNYTIDKYYVVGIVKDENKPIYICYGLPGSYLNPPEKLKGVASFIPKNLFNLLDDGFYMLFQNPRTGKHITPKIDLFGL